jgi:hypothetical protein
MIPQLAIAHRVESRLVRTAGGGRRAMRRVDGPRCQAARERREPRRKPEQPQLRVRIACEVYVNLLEFGDAGRHCVHDALRID